MFSKHLILKVNNEEVLYLYLNDYEEFSNEFKNNNRQENLINNIKNYIINHKINFSGKKIMFVINGLIVGSLMLGTTYLNNINNNYAFSNNKEIKLINKNNIKQAQPIHKDKIVLIKTQDNKLQKISINHYLTTIVGTSIPATYDEEAIKAMALILRTTTFEELYKNKYLSNNNNKYLNINTLKDTWKQHFNEYYNKLYTLVNNTNDEYLIENNYFLNTTYNNNTNHYKTELSTVGLNILAKSGLNYKQIIHHYYPNAKIRNLNSNLHQMK